MIENLMRVEMSYGYDCKRTVDVAKYSDELTAEGNAYRDGSKRNRPSEIGLGEIWVTYDDNGLTPMFKAAVIVKDGIGADELYGIMVKMTDTVKRIMDFSAKGFASRVAGIGITKEEAEQEIGKAVAGKNPGGRVKVDLHSFAGRIMKRAVDTGCVLCNKYKIDIAEWQAFFESQLTNDKVINILRNTPVVKCVGEFADFESDAAREDVESKFSLKLASDAVIKMKTEKEEAK